MGQMLGGEEGMDEPYSMYGEFSPDAANAADGPYRKVPKKEIARRSYPFLSVG